MVDAEVAAGWLMQPFNKRIVAKAANLFAPARRDTGTAFQDQRIAAFREFALERGVRMRTCGRPVRNARIAAGYADTRRLGGRSGGTAGYG